MAELLTQARDVEWHVPLFVGEDPRCDVAQ
jgi:hypothetical protein